MSPPNNLKPTAQVAAQAEGKDKTQGSVSHIVSVMGESFKMPIHTALVIYDRLAYIGTLLGLEREAE